MEPELKMESRLGTIISDIKDQLPYIVEKYNVSSLAVFGSYARNEETDSSDLDILVTFKQAPSLLKFIEMENFLTDKLKIKTDLVMKSALKHNIKNSILPEAITVL